MLADYHLHTPLCKHAEGWPVELAAAAAGLDEIGFSDHNPMSGYFDDWRMRKADLPRYLETVAEAREQFPQLPIRLGLEVDFLPGGEAWLDELAGLAAWDYWIGSVHYLSPDFACDNPFTLHRWDGRDPEEIWRRYTELSVAAIRSRRFQQWAHPDLPKKFGQRPPGDARRFYEPVVEALAGTGMAFEINTAGLRQPVAEMYAAPLFVELAFAAGVPVVLSSDAHKPEHVGFAFGQALELARAVGYRETVRWEGRARKMVPLPVSWPPR